MDSKFVAWVEAVLPDPNSAPGRNPLVLFVKQLQEAIAERGVGPTPDPEPQSHEFNLTGFTDISLDNSGATVVQAGLLDYRGPGFTGTMTIRQTSGAEGGVLIETTGTPGDIINIPLGLDWDPAPDWGAEPLVDVDVTITGVTPGEYDFVFEVEIDSAVVYTAGPFTVTVTEEEE